MNELKIKIMNSDETTLLPEKKKKTKNNEINT